MRVCMRVGAWVRSHFAEVSKIVQDAARAKEHKRPERPRPNTGTQEPERWGDPKPKENIQTPRDLNGKNK